MGVDEKPKNNGAAKVLGVIFAIIGLGFGVLGLVDLFSDNGNILDSIIPEGIKNNFTTIELAVAALFVIISIVIFIISSKKKIIDDDDLSDFNNNVFNYRENKKEEVSNRYEQPKDEFPEEIPDEYKKFIKKADDSDRYLSKEDIGKDRAARPAFTQKTDDEYINQMSNDYEEKISNQVKSSDISESIDTPKIIDFDDKNSFESDVEYNNLVVNNNDDEFIIKSEIFNNPNEPISVEIDSSSIDLSILENAVVETTTYETETLDTNNIDTSTLETNNSDNIVYQQEEININTIDFSVLETTPNTYVTYEYEEVDSNSIDISTLENTSAQTSTEFYTDDININDIDASTLEDYKPAFTYEYQETESISLENVIVDTDVFDIGIYEDNTTSKEPKVYDFAKKAAELAANKAAQDEGKTASRTSAYLNSYLESFASKPSSNTLYSSSNNTSSNNNYNPVFDDDNNNYSADTSVEENQNQYTPNETNEKPKKSDLDSLLDSFTFSKK